MTATIYPGQPSDAQILRSLRYEIATHLAPKAETSLEQTVARMVNQVLGYLITRHTVEPAVQAAECESLAELIKSVKQVLDEANPPEVLQAASMQAASLPHEDEFSAAPLPVRLDALNAELEKLLPSLFDRPWSETVEPLITRLVETSQSVETATQAATLKDEQDYREQRHAVLGQVTTERMEQYLKERFPEKPELRVSSLRELTGGFSKTTITFDVTALEDHTSSLVIKRDMAAGATDTSAVDEFPILKTLFGLGFAVPEPLWIETDRSKLDYPFLAMRKVEGETAGTIWASGQNSTPELAVDIATFLGRLHGLDPSKLELGKDFRSSLTPKQQILSEIKKFRGLWHRERVARDPLLEASALWLERNIPALPERLSIIHGDPGFQNMLIRNGRLTAVIDWELSHLGDPVENLSYMRPHVEPLIPWDEFLAIYRRNGGGAYNEESARFYRVWRGMRLTACTALANTAFVKDKNTELRMGHCGMVVYRRFSLETKPMVGR